MKCEFCNDAATVHLKQVLNDETFEMHLCERCAEERGITDPAGFSLSNLLGGTGDKAEIPELKAIAACPSCEFSLQEMKSVGRLGCPECYEVFNSEVVGMLSSMHRGTEHTGKRPEGMVDETANRDAIAQARQDLQSAIENENFEKAAKLRDTIKELESKIKDS